MPPKIIIITQYKKKAKPTMTSPNKIAINVIGYFAASPSALIFLTLT